MLTVPAACLPLLSEQRTHYADPAREYGEEIARTFDTFRDHLPVDADRVLDIGSGMAGIDVLLGRRYPGATLHLLDKQGVSARINAGFNARAEDFAHYNDFDLAVGLLRDNGVENEIITHDASRTQEVPNLVFDVVVSLLSWGFHYPIATYAPRCRGVMVVDVRMGTDGEDALREYGRVTVVHEAKKYRRVVVQC